MPAAGRLDELFDVERATTVQDETGEPIETWVLWKSVWLARQDLRAFERFRANQDLAVEVAVFHGHYLAGLKHTDRLRRRSDDLIYDVIGIAELGRRAGLEITAQAVRA